MDGRPRVKRLQGWRGRRGRLDALSGAPGRFFQMRSRCDPTVLYHTCLSYSNRFNACIRDTRALPFRQCSAFRIPTRARTRIGADVRCLSSLELQGMPTFHGKVIRIARPARLPAPTAVH